MNLKECGRKKVVTWGTMPADAWRNWEKPVKEPVALFIEPNCPTCRQELYLGSPVHWAVTGRNDLAHKSETQGQQELEHWVDSNTAHNRGPSFGIRDVCSTTGTCLWWPQLLWNAAAAHPRPPNNRRTSDRTPVISPVGPRHLHLKRQGICHLFAKWLAVLTTSRRLLKTTAKGGH